MVLTKNAPFAEGFDIRLAESSDQAWIVGLYTDPEIMQWIPGGVMTAERAHEVSKRAVSGDYKEGLGYYVIRRSGSTQPVGYVVLRDFGWDNQVSGIELGYIIDKTFWSNGIASRVVDAFVKFAAEDLKIPRLLAFVGNENTTSIKVVQKSGFKKLSLRPIQYPENSIWELDLISYCIRK